jgi:beta-glucosidase
MHRSLRYHARGNAVADILFGKANPGGKLPDTFPQNLGQIPLYYNHENTGRPPDPNNKYTSKYNDGPFTPLYPFGYGLSYTTFQFSNPVISSATMTSTEASRCGLRRRQLDGAARGIVQGGLRQ